jgi:UDP-glucuronate 4-epimerase
MNETVLVTGVAGFIGSHLAERLLSIGYRVVGLDNFDDYYSPIIKLDNIQSLQATDGFQMVQGDVRDTGLLARIFSENEISMVAHLAARAGVRPSLEQPLLYQDINIGGTISMLEASRASTVKQFIFASSSSVYGVSETDLFNEETSGLYPISPYAASKASAEIYCHTYSRLYSLPVTVLRLFTVYGPRQRPEMAIHHFVGLVERGEEVALFGDGTSNRDYTYIDDIVAGFEAALMYRREPFQVFNLGGGRTVKLDYLIKVIEEAVGKKARTTYQPQPPGEMPSTLADISKAKVVLGYQPRTTIEEGIPRFVQWYLECRKQQ